MSGKVKERFQSWKLGRDDPQQIETFSMVTLFFSLKELVTKLEIQYFTTFHPSIQLFSLFQFRKLYHLLSYYHNAFFLLWPKRFYLCLQNEWIFVTFLWLNCSPFYAVLFLICTEGESLIFVSYCAKLSNLCYFSPFYAFSFLLCFEGKSFIFVWHCVKWPHQHNVLLHNIVSATR